MSSGARRGDGVPAPGTCASRWEFGRIESVFSRAEAKLNAAPGLLALTCSSERTWDELARCAANSHINILLPDEPNVLSSEQLLPLLRTGLRWNREMLTEKPGHLFLRNFRGNVRGRTKGTEVGAKPPSKI